MMSPGGGGGLVPPGGIGTGSFVPLGVARSSNPCTAGRKFLRFFSFKFILLLEPQRSGTESDGVNKPADSEAVADQNDPFSGQGDIRPGFRRLLGTARGVDDGDDRRRRKDHSAGRRRRTDWIGGRDRDGVAAQRFARLQSLNRRMKGLTFLAFQIHPPAWTAKRDDSS